MMSVNQKSMQEKLNLAYKLACKLAYDPNGKPSNIDDNDVWNYVDGLWAKYHEDRIFGNTSLQKILEYDMEEEEKRLDLHIKKFKNLIIERR